MKGFFPLVFVGDESGLVKTVDWKKGRKVVPSVEIWEDAAFIDKSRSVLRLSKVSNCKEKDICVARKDGSLERWRWLDSEMKMEKSDFCQMERDEIIGVASDESRAWTVHSDGYIRCQSWSNDFGKEGESSSRSIMALEEKDLTVAKFDLNRNILICGGKEKDLTVWNLEQAMSLQDPNHFIQGSRTFQAKNVKNDSLDLRVPVFISDLDFVPQNPESQFVVGTAYRHIRLYDIKAQRRPVQSNVIGEHPIKKLIHGPDSLVFCSDTVGQIFAVDLRKANEPVWKITDIAGAVTDLSFDFRRSLLLSCSLDRHLRIHNPKLCGDGRGLVVKSYLKQRLTCAIFNDFDATDQIQNNSNDMEDFDDVDEIFDEFDVIDDAQFLRDAKKAKTCI